MVSATSLFVFGLLVAFAAAQIPSYDQRVRTLMVANGYKEYEGVGFYKYHIEPANWIEARQICMDEGAHLAVPTSQTDADRLVKIYKENPRSNVPNPDQFMIGFHDLMKEGRFETVLGGLLKDSGYARWGPNQPDNGTGENCGSMFTNGLLNDYYCEVKNNFICERKFEVPNPNKRSAASFEENSN